MKTFSFSIFVAASISAFSAPADYNAVSGYGTRITGELPTNVNFVRVPNGLDGPFFDPENSDIQIDNITLSSEVAQPGSMVKLGFTLTLRNTNDGYYEEVFIQWEPTGPDWKGTQVGDAFPMPDLVPNGTSSRPQPFEILVPVAERDAAVADVLAGKRLRPIAIELHRFTLPAAAVDSDTDIAYVTHSISLIPGEVQIIFDTMTPLLASLQANTLLVESPRYYQLQRPGGSNPALSNLISAEEVYGNETYGQGRRTNIIEVLGVTVVAGDVVVRARGVDFSSVLEAATFFQRPQDAFDDPQSDPFRPPLGNNAFSNFLDVPVLGGKGPRHRDRITVDGFRAMHFPINNLQLATGITLDGQILLDALNIEIQVRFRRALPQRIAIKIGSKAEITLRLSATAFSDNTREALDKREKQIFNVPLPPITFNIAGFPIEIAPFFKGKVGAEINVPTNVVIPIQASVEAGCVVGWDSRRPRNDKFFYIPFQKQRPLTISNPLINDSLEFSASAFAEVGLDVKINRLAGPYVGARATAEFALDPQADTWWSLDLKLKTIARFRAEIFGLSLSDVTDFISDAEDLLNKIPNIPIPGGSGLPGGTPPGSYNPVSGAESRWARTWNWEGIGPTAMKLARSGSTGDDMFGIAPSTTAIKQPIFRIGSKGQMLWMKEMPFLTPVTIAPQSSDNFMLGGFYFSDGFVSLHDGNGTTAWSRFFTLRDAGGARKDFSIVKIVNSQGATYVVGRVSNGLEDDIYVVKIFNGAVEWLKRFGAANMDEEPGGAVAVSSGGIVVCGIAAGDPNVAGVPGPGAEGGGLLLRIHPDGTVVWAVRVLSGLDYRSVTSSPDGALFVAGFYNVLPTLDIPTIVVARHRLSDGQPEGIVMISEDEGDANPTVPGATRNWLPVSGRTQADTSVSAAWTDIGLVVGGTTGSGADRAPLVMALSEQLSLRWFTTFEGTSADDGLFDIAATDSGIFVAGHTKSFSTLPGGGSVALFTKVPWEGKLDPSTLFGAPTNGALSRYLLPAVMQFPAAAGLVGIPQTNQGYTRTEVLSIPVTNETHTTTGGPLPNLGDFARDMSASVTYSSPLQKDSRDFAQPRRVATEFNPESTRTTAILAGIAFPGGSTGTARFEWGNGSNPDQLTNLTPGIPISASQGSIPFSFPITGLAEDGRYYFRARLDGTTGTLYGAINTFYPRNKTPIANDDQRLLVPSDAPTVLPVLGNDTDPDGDALLITSRTNDANNGTVTISPDGKSLIYNAIDGFTGVDSFYYTVSDGDLFDQAFVTVVVGCARSPLSTLTLFSSSGDPVPDPSIPSALITTLGTPAISDNSILTCTMGYRDSRRLGTGILTQQPDGTSSVLARTGKSIPGRPSSFFSSFGDPAISPGGAIAFLAKSRGPGINSLNDHGLWTTLGGGLQRVIAEGGSLPFLGTERVSLISSFSIRNGEILALVRLRSGSSVTSSNDSVLVRITPDGNGSVLTRDGGPIGGGETAIAKTISALMPALGSAGHGRSQGDLGSIAKIGTPLQNEKLVRFLPDGTPEVIVSTGNEAQAIGPGTFWHRFGLPSFAPDSSAYTTHTTLRPVLGGVTTRSDTALIFRAFGNPLEVIAREGNPAPGTIETFASFLDPLLNIDFNVSFQATLRGETVSPSNLSGIWFGDPASPTLIARTGSTATDYDGLPLTGVRWISFSTQALPGCHGGPVFLAQLAGTGVTAADRTGLWALDSSGNLILLLRTGETFNVNGSSRRVSNIGVLGSIIGPQGATRSFNALGTLAARITFTDRSHVLVRLDVP